MCAYFFTFILSIFLLRIFNLVFMVVMIVFIFLLVPIFVLLLSVARVKGFPLFLQ